MTTPTDRRVWLAGCLVALFGLVVSPIIAQPPPPLPGANDKADAAGADDEPNVRRIYVPTAQLNALLNGDRQGVLLPREEFRRLFEEAKQADRNELHTPGGIVVSSAAYAGEIVDEQLQLKVSVQLRQFDPGWQIARLPLGGLSLQSALLDDGPAAVARDGKQRNLLMLFCETPGDHQLTLTLTAPLKSVGSDWLAEFQTLGVPAGLLSLTVPDGKSLLVDGLKQPTAGEGDNRYQVPLGGRERVSLRITDRNLRHAADSLVFANTAYGLQVAPGEVTWTTQTSVQAYGQSLSQLKFSVPKALEVAAVESTGLEEWTLGETDRGRRTLITLDYRQPFEGERTVTIRGVLVPDAEEWTVPNLVLEQADSHAATIVVRHGVEVRLQSDYGEDVRPVSVKEARTLEFRTMDPQFDLEFRTLGKQRSVQVAMTNLLDITDDGLDLQTVMDVDTYFVSLFDVRVTLPAEFEVTSASVGGQSVEWSIGTGTAGVIEVRLPLDPPLAPGDTRQVSLSAHADPEDWPLERDPALLPFPEVGLPQANMVEARYGIMADADLDVRTSELTGLDPARQADVAGLQQAAAALGKQLRLGFNYQDTRFSGQLEVTRKPTRLAVSTLSLSRLDPQTVHTDMRAFVTVEGGGTQGLLIDLPEDTGTDLRFTVLPGSPIPLANAEAPRTSPVNEPVAIVEQTVTGPAAGLRTWALRFDRRMRGNHVIQVTLNQPRTAEEDVILPAATFTGAERQNGWVALEARTEQNLQVTATADDGQPLLRVDPIDLPGMGGDITDRRRIVAGVRYVRPGYNVSVSAETFTSVAVPTAMADRMNLVSVLSERGLLQHQLDVTFRAVGMQSLRFVLPERADVWAVLIDGTPVEVRQAGGTYQVPLASVDDPAAARTLRLIYRSQVDPTGSAGRLQQSPPLIAAVSGSGSTQPLEVLEQDWTLHYPRDVVLLDSRGLFTPVGELSNDTWLARMREAVTLPTLVQAGWRVGIAVIVALVIACIVVMVRRFGRWSLALIVVVPILGLLLLALLLPAVQQAREAAKRTTVGDTLAAYETTESMDLDMAGGFAGEAAPEAGAFGGGGGIGGGGGGGEIPLSGWYDSELLQATPPPASEPMPSFGAVDAINGPQAPQAGMPIEAAPSRAAEEPAEAQAEEPPIAGRAAGGTVTMAAPPARGALLSLSLDLQTPDGLKSQEFQTLASDTAQTAPALVVSYASRSFREVMVLCLAAGLALLMWWLRHASLKCRLACVLATIVLPIALVPITPAWLTMIVEGLLLGGIAGIVLWSALAIVTWLIAACRRCCPAGWTSRTSANTVTGLVLAASLLASGGSVQAQEMKTPPSPSSTGALPTVVIPYAGDDPLDAHRVYLPQALFRELWLKAHPDERPRPGAPVAGLVAEALYAIDVTDENVADDVDGNSQVRVRGRLVLFGFHKSSVWLPLPLDQVAVTTASIDGEPAVLRPGKKGQPEVLIAGNGLHVLDLEFDLPAELRSDSGQVTLPLRPVTAGSLKVTLPAAKDGQDVRVLAGSNQAIGSRITTTPQGRRQVEVPVDQGGPLRISWQPQATRGGTDNIVHVTSQTAVDVADDGVQIIADYQLQVRQGVLAEVLFRFPETVRLKRITGADVGGWQIDGEGDERTLTIFLRRNVSDATQITAELYLPLDDRRDAFNVDVPPFAPLDVTRETGDVVVLAGSHLEVRATAFDGLRQLDRDEVVLPESLVADKARVQLAYRFVMRPWTLRLSVSPRPSQASASSEHGVSIGHRKVRYASRFVFDLTGAPQQTLKIMLTEEFLLTSVIGDGVDDWFVENAELVIDFGQPRVGRVELVLEGHQPRNPGDETAVVITPLPLELDRQQSVLAVWVDPMYAATLDTFDTWRTIDRAQLPAELRALQTAEPQFAFRSSATEPEIINLSLMPQQPQITADGVTLIAVSDVSVDYGLTLRWTIERAATDTLTFTVPGWLEDRLEITGEAIRQTTQTVTDEGLVRWSVQLTDAVSGQYLLSAIATLPPPEDGQVSAPSIVFEQPPTTPERTYVAVEAQQTFAVLVNLSQGRLTPAGDFTDLNVQRRQLPLVLRDDLLAQAMAIVRRPADVDVAWTLQRATGQPMQAAQVTAAELTSVLAMDGSVRTLAKYRVRNRGQQFLALQLPDSARLLSVLVKGKPARGLKAQIGELPVTLIPLPQTSAADLSFLVQVVLADQLPNVRRLDASALGQTLDLPVPRVISSLQSSEFGMPVVYTSWTVHLPEEFEAEIDDRSVDGKPRSNLTPQPVAAAREMAEVQLYRELDDLNRLVIDKGVTAVQRSKALSNLGALRKQLESFDSRSPREADFSSLAPADREFAQQKEQLLEESFRNVQQAQQQLQRDEQVIADDTGSTTNTLGKDFIVGNSASIISDNFGRGVVRSEETFNKFQLNSPTADKKEEAAKAGKPSDSRSQLRDKLQSQLLDLQAPQASQQPEAPEAGSRMGIGGGGFPAGEFARQQNLGDQQFGYFAADGISQAEGGPVSGAAQLGAPSEWFEAGGLSLPIDLPTPGQTLTFTKPGGDPRLALSVRPRETGTIAIRWVWAVVVLIAGAWLLHQLAHRASVQQIRRGLTLFCIGVGLIGLLCLPLPLNLLSGAVLVLGCVLALLDHQQSVGT